MNRIRELRTQHKMTQAELASTMSCTKMTISRYESEQREIDSATINQVCDIFHVSADYLLCRSDIPDPYLSDEDAALIRAYHAAPENVRAAIDSLLQPGSGKEKPAGSEARAAG